MSFLSQKNAKKYEKMAKNGQKMAEIKNPFINSFCPLHAKNYGFWSKNEETVPQLPDPAVYDWPLFSK